MTTREYTWGLNYGGGIGGLLNLNQGGLEYSYLYDGKGNVTALLDASQNIVATYRYDAFGNLMSETGTLNQPFQFATKRYDEKTGLSYYGYRYYSPSIGRWITRDPIGELGGINLYGFVGNNPINFIDPYGYIGITGVAAIISGVYGAAAVIVFLDCMQRLTGTELPRDAGECPPPPPQTFANAADICLNYAILLGFGADPFGSTAQTIGSEIGESLSGN